MSQTISNMVGLWFKTEAIEAANFYCSIFPNSKILQKYSYPPSIVQKFGLPSELEMGVDFSLNGNNYSAFNGNSVFNFTDAVSLVVKCKTQEEIDYYWEKLQEGVSPRQCQCGWLKDKFGVTWQVIPSDMDKYLGNSDPDTVTRVFEAMMPMKKLIIAELEAAYNQI